MDTHQRLTNLSDAKAGILNGCRLQIRKRILKKGKKVSAERLSHTIETYFRTVNMALPTQALGLHTFQCMVAPEHVPCEKSPTLQSLLVIDNPSSLLDIWTVSHENQIAERWTPLVISQKWLPYYLKLRPTISEAIHQGRTLGNSPFSPIAVTTDDRITKLTEQWFNVASQIASKVVPEESQQKALHTLEHLIQDYNLDPRQSTLSHLSSFSEVAQTYFSPKPPHPRNPSAPAPLPQLLSVYVDLDSAILVVPDAVLTPLLTRVDWQSVLNWLTNSDWGYVVSESQFHYLSRHIIPIDFKIGRYTLAWGKSLIEPDEIEFNSLIKSAMRDLFRIGVEVLPQSYLASQSYNMSPIIHDIQNHLLRIQLQFDLVKYKLGLPDHQIGALQAPSEWSSDRRIDAILTHIEAWLNYYHSLLVETP